MSEPVAQEACLRNPLRVTSGKQNDLCFAQLRLMHNLIKAAFTEAGCAVSFQT